SLIRAESKFNGYITEFVYDYFHKYGKYPSVPEIRERANNMRDLIAYRIIISLPKGNLPKGTDLKEAELKLLYEIANALPEFLEERGFTAELSGLEGKISPLLTPEAAPYYRDYIAQDSPTGYKSLHISFYDNSARSYIEVQLRTKDMDDFAEIGPANHLSYENQQMAERTRNDLIQSGECIYFDEALARFQKLQAILLKDLDVNMFGAISDTTFNDSCGLYRGRQILPYEHLSKYQSGNIG
ncbi:MAG: hypothetical protein KBS81_00320, partial [Spirochaetales bacterium]|nr:hypothetical protein [Candidatus Physcosoma equi]